MIDVHCHLDRFLDPDAIIAEIQVNQIRTIAVSTGMDSFQRVKSLCAGHSLIIPAFGLHPTEASASIGRLDTIWQRVAEETIIGEIGLDRFFLEDKDDYYLQVAVFETILEQCRGKKKILNIHSRSAERDVLRLLAQYEIEHAILHWFVGPERFLPEIMEHEYYVSVGPALCYSDKMQRLVALLPHHLLLTESDGPTRYRNGQIGHPALVANVVSEIALLWNMSVQETDALIECNFTRLLNSIL